MNFAVSFACVYDSVITGPHYVNVVKVIVLVYDYIYVYMYMKESKWLVCLAAL